MTQSVFNTFAQQLGLIYIHQMNDRCLLNESQSG